MRAGYVHVVGKGDIVRNKMTGETAEILHHDAFDYITKLGRWEVAICEWVGSVEPGYIVTTTDGDPLKINWLTGEVSE